MYNISQIISLPVISIYESCNVGIITEVLFDNTTKRAIALCIVDENEISIKKSINMRSIYKIGADAVIIRNCDQINLQECDKIGAQNLVFPNNFTVFDTDGVKLGNVTDIELDASYKITKIIVDNNTSINASRILTFKQNILIIKNSNLKLSSFKSSKKIKVNLANDYIVKNLNDASIISSGEIVRNLDEKEPIETAMLSSTISVSTPQKIITNYNFLIGRKVLQNIVNTNGEILARKDSIITYKMLNNMRKYGKLCELMSYSK